MVYMDHRGEPAWRNEKQNCYVEYFTLTNGEYISTEGVNLNTRVKQYVINVAMSIYTTSMHLLINSQHVVLDCRDKNCFTIQTHYC